MKTLLLSFFSLTLTLGVFAQGNVVFQDAEQNDMPDTVKIVHDLSEGDDLPYAFALEGYITNTTSAEQEIAINRIIIDYIEGCGDQVCWAMECKPYGSGDAEVLSGIQALVGGEAFDLVSGSVFHYNHKDVVGATTLKYVLMNGETAEDSVVVVYELTNNSGVGVFSETAGATLTHPYPNPAINTVKVNYSVVNNSARIVLRNVIGKTVAVNEVYNQTGTTTFNLSSLPSGVYFISIVQQGSVLENKKFIKR